MATTEEEAERSWNYGRISHHRSASMEAALRKIVEKCEQYANAPRLCEAEQHAVHEWIERQARTALGDDQ
jgi:hypothetical protein